MNSVGKTVTIDANEVLITVTTVHSSTQNKNE